MGSEFLLEIGTEEIPARFIPPAMEEMAESFRRKLAQERGCACGQRFARTRTGTGWPLCLACHLGPGPRM